MKDRAYRAARERLVTTLDALPPPGLPSFEVRETVLVQSLLQPGGAHYQVLYRLPLGGGG